MRAADLSSKSSMTQHPIESSSFGCSSGRVSTVECSALTDYRWLFVGYKVQLNMYGTNKLVKSTITIIFIFLCYLYPVTGAELRSLCFSDFVFDIQTVLPLYLYYLSCTNSFIHILTYQSSKIIRKHRFDQMFLTGCILDFFQ